MSTVGLILITVAALIIWGLYKLFGWIAKQVKKTIRNRNQEKERQKLSRDQERERQKLIREIKEFEESIEYTKKFNSRKVFDSNQTYHYETTFLIYFKDGGQSAMTVPDGIYNYDVLVSKLRE